MSASNRPALGGFVAAATTYAAAPAVRALLIKSGLFDIPNHRSSHTIPVPRGGGLACLAGVAVGLAAADRRRTIPVRVLAGVASITGAGLADDFLGNVDHNLRLAVQVAAGAAIAPTALHVPLVMFGTAGVVNVVNFMDGINGITGSTAAVWGISTVLIGRRELDPNLQVIGAVTAGAGLGFLPWNAPQARLFLGDVGSYLIGGLMAAGITAGRRPALMLRVALPLLPYGLDAASTALRRLARGISITEPHREHVYQRLVHEVGFTHLQVATAHAVLSTASTALIIRGGHRSSLIAAAAIAAYIDSPRWTRPLLQFRRDRAQTPDTTDLGGDSTWRPL